MTMRSYEERVQLRLMMENPGIAHDIEVGDVVDPAIDGRRYIEGDDAARIAALEHQDTVDPLSHHPRTAVLRKPLELDLDEESLAQVVAGEQWQDLMDRHFQRAAQRQVRRRAGEVMK